MNSALPKTGGCQCGNIRYRITALPITFYVCHCRDCQQQSSSAFGMSLIIPAGGIEWLHGENNLKHWNTRGQNGAIKRCFFCDKCGSRIMHGSDNATAHVSIKAGTLDRCDDLQPVAHIWLASAQPWFTPGRDGLKGFQQEPDDAAELERLWQQHNSS